MRIVFLLTYYTPHWTGLTEHARRVAEGLAARGHSVCVITTQHKAELPKTEKIAGVTVHRAGVVGKLSRTLLSPELFVMFFREIPKQDVVVIYTPFAEVLAASILVKLFGRRLILVHNGDLLLPKGFFNRIIESVFDVMTTASGHLADCLIAYSEDYAKHSRLLSQFLRKVFSIYPLFPKVTIDTKRTELLSKKFPKNKKQFIGFSGRFVEEKGFDILLAAMPLVLEKLPHAHFVFAGQLQVSYERFYESQKAHIEAQKNNITMLGLLKKEDMPSFYSLIDVFVLPSRSECMGLVQVEAMLSGTPVVATDIAGGRVPVQKTGMGLLVKSENPHDLARGIIEALAKKNKLKKNVSAVKKVFDYEKTVKQFEEVICKSPTPTLPTPQDK